jgi:hypothetical protein
VIVSDLPRWWVVDGHQGTLRSWEDAEPRVNGAGDIADTQLHFPDVSWLNAGAAWRCAARLRSRGARRLSSRPATRCSTSPGSDLMLLALDLERGVLLRAECFLRDVLLAVEEVVEVAFDQPLRTGLLEQPRLEQPSQPPA